MKTLILLLIPFFSYGQATLFGIITDKDTKEPISDVVVVVKNTCIKTLSDINGTFDIHTRKKFVNLEFKHKLYRKIKIKKFEIVGDFTTIEGLEMESKFINSLKKEN